MNSRILAGAAAVAVALSPAALSAQGVNSIDDKRPELTEEQQATYDAWPEERRVAYEAWTPEYQVYYWTLTPAQSEGWWVLNPEQRTQLYAMTPDQRAAAWSSIVAQINASPAATQAAASSKAKTTTAVTYQSNPVVQQVPANTVEGEYPVCKSESDDACIQPRAAGLDWGNRPLDHWPGKPASEM